MKHIKNFRNFSMNEGNYHMSIRSDKSVHQNHYLETYDSFLLEEGIIQTIRQGYNWIVDKIKGTLETVKNYLGDKYEKFKTYFITLGNAIKEIDKKDLKEISSEVKDKFGKKSKGDIEKEVKKIIEEQYKGSKKEDGGLLKKIFGDSKLVACLAPVVTPMVHKVTVASGEAANTANSLNTAVGGGSVNATTIICIVAMILFIIFLFKSFGSTQN